MDISKPTTSLSSLLPANVPTNLEIVYAKDALTPEQVIEKALDDENYYIQLEHWFDEKAGSPSVAKPRVVAWLKDGGKEKTGAYKYLIEALIASDEEKLTIYDRCIKNGTKDTLPYWLAHLGLVKTYKDLNQRDKITAILNKLNTLESYHTDNVYEDFYIYAALLTLNKETSYSFSKLSDAALSKKISRASYEYAARLLGNPQELIKDPKMLEKCNTLLKIAIDLGSLSALTSIPEFFKIHNTAYSLTDNEQIKINYLCNKKAALEGCLPAQYNVGVILRIHHQDLGFEKKEALKAALDWFKMAIDDKYLNADQRYSDLLLRHYEILGYTEKTAIKLAEKTTTKSTVSELLKKIKLEEKAAKTKAIPKSLNDRSVAITTNSAAKSSSQSIKGKGKKEHKSKEQQKPQTPSTPSTKPDTKSEFPVEEAKKKEREKEKDPVANVAISSIQNTSTSKEKEKEKEDAAQMKKFEDDLRARDPFAYDHLFSVSEGYNSKSLKRKSVRSITKKVDGANIDLETPTQRPVSLPTKKQEIKKIPLIQEKTNHFKNALKGIDGQMHEAIWADINKLIAEWPNVTSSVLKLKKLSNMGDDLYQIYANNDYRVHFLVIDQQKLVLLNIYKKDGDEMPLPVREATIKAAKDWRQANP